MALLIAFLLFTGVSVVAQNCPNTSATVETKPLYLLTLVPFPDSRDGAGFDEGLRLLPGARVAQDEINNLTDLLPGYHIELIERNAEACSLPAVDYTLLNLVKYGIQAVCHPMPAIIGLICSSHTIALSPIAGRSGIDLLQLAAANSPRFITENHRFPHLWRFLGSADAYGDAALALMNQYGWRRIGVVYAAGSDFFTGMAEHFERVVHTSPDKEVVFSYGITGTRDLVLDQIIDNIRSEGVTLLFMCLDSNEIAALLCRAAADDIGYPSHIWLLASAFPDLIVSSGLCDRPTLERAIQGHLLLHTPINPKNASTTLVSGDTFATYVSKYGAKLKEVQIDYKYETLSPELQYSSLLYDQMWAFALALNRSLPEMKKQNLSIEQYTTGRHEITELIEEQLINLDFQGASGHIKFDSKHGVDGLIDILNLTAGGQQVLLGTYDPRMMQSDIINLTDYPRGEPLVEYVLMHTVVASLLYIIAIFTIAFTTILFALVLYLRKWPEVKSTSPYLSLFMLAGCYLLCLAVIFHIALASSLLSPTAYTALLNIYLILVVNGISFILLTLFIKLLRIYHIFVRVQLHFGTYWKSCFLAGVILFLSILPNLIIALQIGIDTPHHAERVSYTLSGSELVAIKQSYPTTVRSSFLSFLAILAYFTVFLVCIIYLAVRTRKIEDNNFKDTKKVNLFVSILVFVLALVLPLSILLYNARQQTVGDAIMICGVLVITISCQLLLFLPKVLPVVFFRGKQPRKGSFMAKFSTQNQSQFRSISLTVHSETNRTWTYPTANSSTL